MKIWRVEDDELKLRPHSGQAKAWRSDKRFVFMLAGTQGGKTSFGPWWLEREIQRCGEGDYLAVTASFDLFKLKMLPEMRTVFEQLRGIGRYWAGDKILEIREPGPEKWDGPFHATRASDPMWARIILRSAQSEGGLESATANAAWLDECGQDKFKLSDWEAVLRRLSLSQGRVLGGTTLYNLGWLKSQVYDQWRAGDPDFDVIQFRSTANPAFPQAEYDRARRTLPAWKLRMFYEGQFDKPAGLIYDVFDEDVHICEPIPIPPDWPRVVGIDPLGAVTVALWLAWNPHNQQLHIYREMYNPYGKTTAENAADVLRLSSGERIIKYIGGGPSERQARLDWQACGVPLEEPPVSSVESGIDGIYGLFKNNSIVIHRGEVPHLVDELGVYSRKLDANDEPTETIKDKGSFHCADSLRYAVVWLITPTEGLAQVSYSPVRVGRW